MENKKKYIQRVTLFLFSYPFVSIYLSACVCCSLFLSIYVFVYVVSLE